MPEAQVGHFSPDAPPVDVLVDGDAVFESVDFRDVTDLEELDEGEHAIEVRPHGEDYNVLESDIELEENTHYIILASGLVGENDLQLSVISHEE